MPNAPRSIADIWGLIADAIPDAPALVYGTKVVTWREFDRDADRVGAALLERGLGPQAKVAQYLYNGTEYLVTVYGCFKAGLVPVNTNYRYAPPELEYLWTNADVEAVFFHGTFRPQVDAIRSRLDKIRLWIWVDDRTGPCPPWAVSYEDFLAGSARPCAPVGSSGDDLYLLYTGGTTGMPKGVMWRQHDLFWYLNGGSVEPIPPGASDSEIGDGVRRGRRPAYLVACPLMHGTGSLTAFRALGQGGSVVLVPGHSLDIAALLGAVARAHVHTLVIVGDAFGRPIADALDQHPGDWDISCLEEIMSSGVMWSEGNKRALLRHNTSMTLVDSLASSEALGIGRSTMTADTGTPTATFELSSNAVIVDDQGAVIPPTPGATGRLAVRRSIPLGYYKDEEHTRQTFVEIDGERLAIPGDFARYDADGKVQLLGRGSSSINTGGEKVYPEEVEEALKTHGAVADVAVVGMPDDRFGQSIVALVALSAGAVVPTSDELSRHVKTRLASYKAPRTFVIVDAVPRTPSGKLDYPAIAHHLQVRVSSDPVTAGS